MSLSIRSPLHKCATLADIRSFVKDDIKKAKIDIAQRGGRRISFGSDSICVKDITNQLDKICRRLDFEKLSLEQQGQLYEILDGIKVINLEFATDKLLSKKGISCFQKLMTRIRQFFGNLFSNSAKTCDALLSKMTHQLFKPYLQPNSGLEYIRIMQDDTTHIQQDLETMCTLFEKRTRFDYMIPILKKIADVNPMFLSMVVHIMLESRTSVVQKCQLLNFIDSSLFPGYVRSESRRDTLKDQYDKLIPKKEPSQLSEKELRKWIADYKAYFPVDFRASLLKEIFKPLLHNYGKIFIDLGDTQLFAPTERLNYEFAMCLFEYMSNTPSYEIPGESWFIEIFQSETHQYTMDDIRDLLNYMRNNAKLNIKNFVLSASKYYQQGDIKKVHQRPKFTVTEKDAELLKLIKEKQNIKDENFRLVVDKSK